MGRKIRKPINARNFGNDITSRPYVRSITEQPIRMAHSSMTEACAVCCPRLFGGKFYRQLRLRKTKREFENNKLLYKANLCIHYSDQRQEKEQGD